MKFRISLLSLLLGSICLFSSTSVSQNLPEDWTEWLKEVEPIMSKAELSVFRSLKTQEDRSRFQRLFWEARDPSPGTAQNEYMIEYYQRSRYAESELDGINSDRGKIYILLGKPQERNNFSGYDMIEDCELWTYQIEDRPGIPRQLALIFYRPQGVGRYRLFYPGAQTALDILSSQYISKISSSTRAFSLLRSSFPELAYATLSVVPGEAVGTSIASLNSSNTVLANIFSLTEKEAERNYLKSFGAMGGTVDVTFTSREIGGKGCISLTEARGVRFLSYSVMPDVVNTRRAEDNLYRAKILINIRIEDESRKTIAQQERVIDLSFDDQRMEGAKDRRVVFNDFLPVVEGNFTVNIRCYNETADDFFTFEEKISVNSETVPVVLGHEVVKDDTADFAPFRLSSYKVLFDPRFIYQPGDSLEGVMVTAEEPEIRLSSLENPGNFLKIEGVERNNTWLIFKQPLLDIPPGNYTITIIVGGEVIFKKIVSILSVQFEKPQVFDRIEPQASEGNYIFMLGQEYLSQNKTDKSLEFFQRLPENFWNSTNVPFLAQAYYSQKEFSQVIAVLDREDVAKSYSTLLLLANSYVELHQYAKAAETFESLRQYGDTVEICNALGAVYFSLGEKEKAKLFWEKAKALKEKRQIPERQNSEK